MAVKFVIKSPEPFNDLSQLHWNGRPLVTGLNAEILDPFLARWGRQPGDRRDGIRGAVDEAMQRCTGAFKACAPERTKPDERALMAALAVTANLQRTLTYLGEVLGQPKRRGERRGTVILCRQWCGLVPKAKRSAVAGTGSFRPLVKALGCSPGEIDARCRDALSALRKDFTAGQWM